MKGYESYLISWADELTARSNRVRYLIGDTHWASDGAHNENVLKSFLRQYSPNFVDIATGFIRCQGTQAVSPQIDIMIIDTLSSVPLFSEGDLYIVNPPCVRAYFEVKSTFDSSTCNESLIHVKSIQDVVLNSINEDKIWRGIFFNNVKKYKRSTTPSDIVMKCLDKIFDSDPAIGASSLPNCIVANGNFVCFLSTGSINIDEVQVRFFDAKKYSLACALSDLLTYILPQENGTGLEEAIELLEIPHPKVKLLGG